MSNSSKPSKAELQAIANAKAALLAEQAASLGANTSSITATLLGVSKGDEDSLCLHMNNGSKLWFSTKYFSAIATRTNVPTRSLLKAGRSFTYDETTHAQGDSYYDEDGSEVGTYANAGTKHSKLVGIFDFDELELAEATSVVSGTPKQV